MSSASTAQPKTGRPVLGRGLLDLIPDGGNGSGKNALSSIAGTLGAAENTAIGEEVPLTLLHPNPKQPRTRFDEQALAELADSIKEHGILQPILVRPRPAPLPGYEIVAGERRYRAARKAGLTKVPVVIKPLADDETLALALIENLIREDIGPLETARAFSRLMSEFGWTQEEMGRRVGKSRVAVANSLRLLKLPSEIQEALESGELSEGHARGLLGGEGNDADGDRFRQRQNAVFLKVIEEKLTVRDVERLMKVIESPAVTGTLLITDNTPTAKTNVSREIFDVSRETKSATSARDLDIQALEDRLRSVLGTKVRLHLDTQGEGGRIELTFFSAEELDGLTERLIR